MRAGYVLYRALVSLPVQAKELAHARAIGVLLRKNVTNCKEMMSWYFPIIAVVQLFLSGYSDRYCTFGRDKTEYYYYEGLQCQHPAVVANDCLYSIIGRLAPQIAS